MRVALDANCFIDAINPSSHAFTPMEVIVSASRAGVLELAVSLHTLAELARKPDAALDLARSCATLPHYPIGAWDTQVATWDQAEGTWDDVTQHDGIQERISDLAKAGNDIRDRGAYLDALKAGVDAFVTSDRQLVDSAPARRLETDFGVQVITPEALSEVLQSTTSNSEMDTDAKRTRGSSPGR
jgi:predicted nucleic acid-binding protein